MSREGFSEVVFVAVEIKQFWNESVNVRLLIICPNELCLTMIGQNVFRIVQFYHFTPGGTKHYLM